MNNLQPYMDGERSRLVIRLLWNTLKSPPTVILLWSLYQLMLLGGVWVAYYWNIYITKWTVIMPGVSNKEGAFILVFLIAEIWAGIYNAWNKYQDELVDACKFDRVRL